jgi:inorganic pyrophosphatase
MKAIIEIPKGDDRRRHLKYDKTGFVDLGPIKDVIPVNGGVMPVHYGYVPETVNPKEGDEIDILVLSDEDLKVGQEVEVRPIALIKRADEDDKVVAVDAGNNATKSWSDIPEDMRTLAESFFSYHHCIVSIEDVEAAARYVEENRCQES